MSDTHQPKRPLSEISHLFLSGVRERQTGGAARPVRRPPVDPRHSIDLTPEEFAQVFGAAESADAAPAGSPAAEHMPTLTAVISAHLNGSQHERVRQYARHLAAGGQRIGLLEVDAHEFRLTCFECGQAHAADVAPEHALESFDVRRMSEAVEELSTDVDRWLLVLPNPRSPEARALLRQVDHWVMLSTCDHDGVVSCYRMLKGLSDMHRPQLTLGLLDVRDETQAARVFRKLSSVCQQFLHWPLEPEPAIGHVEQIAEHLVLFCQASHDKAQLASAGQWQATGNLISRLKSSAAAAHSAPSTEAPVSAQTSRPPSSTRHLADVVVTPPQPATGHSSLGAHRETGKDLPIAPPLMRAVDDASSVGSVIDLPGEGETSTDIITAIIRDAAGELIECPVRAPMCPQAHLTIDRNRQLILLAVAGEGLGELRVIAQAYRWLMENRALVAMALPQFAIDAMRLPQLRLLVDHADLSAELLQPLLQSGNVKVQAYRKLRWGEKMGLLLEAA